MVNARKAFMVLTVLMLFVCLFFHRFFSCYILQTAAVFVYGMPHFRKRRNSLLSNVLEEFIRNKYE